MVVSRARSRTVAARRAACVLEQSNRRALAVWAGPSALACEFASPTDPPDFAPVVQSFSWQHATSAARSRVGGCREPAVQGCRGALQQYRELRDTIFDVVVVHRHGKIIKDNPAADARGVHEARGDDWNAGRRTLSLSPLPLARRQPWDWMPVSDVTPMTSRRPISVYPSGWSGDG